MKKAKRRQGVAAVEAAICFPILALIVFGAVEISGGIFQEYNAQASAYELSKVALRSRSTCEDVQTMAAQLLPSQGFNVYTIDIEVEPRTTNQNSVDPPTISTFTFSQSGSAPTGLDELPRGTLLKLTLTTDRPAIAGRGFFRSFLGNQISSDCVFVKEF